MNCYIYVYLIKSITCHNYPLTILLILCVKPYYLQCLTVTSAYVIGGSRFYFTFLLVLNNSYIMFTQCFFYYLE